MSSVDTKGQTDFYDYLLELNKTVTIVLVSHDAMVLSSHAKSVACVNRQLFCHDTPEITKDMLEMAYHCPVELIGHGLPHRVLPEHTED
jgi:zinc transport system ATP-binding protein